MDALKFHKKFKGKVEINPKMKVSLKNLCLLYTPGVASVAREIAKNSKNSFVYTCKANNVAIITDGTRTIGVGNNIPEASMPIMEGKSVLFKSMAGVDAYPLCLGTKNLKEIVRTIEILVPTFGAFNLEDIESPKCFEISKELERRKILFFHDDRQGTGIVVLAGLLNALRAVGKEINKIKICLAGGGTAGYGVFEIFKEAGAKNITVLDSHGIIYQGRKGNNKYTKEMAKFSNPENKKGGLEKAIENADVFIGLTGASGLLKSSHIAMMKESPIIFALSNPSPEIFPSEIEKVSKNYIYATGRSDFQNQINNALAFPGVFRGLLDSQKKITLKLEIKIANAIAGLIKKPLRKKILPNVLDKRLSKKISECF